MNKKNQEALIKSIFRNFPFNLIRTTKSMFRMAREDKNALPYKLIFESSTICNLKCTTCCQNYMKRKKGHLKFEVFKKIYDEVKPPYLNLTGFGEPLLNPDLFKIIKYARKKGSFVKVDTNGMLLTKENAEKLLDTGIDIVSNSIDGMDKKTYESIRIGANFERVIENLKNFVKMRNERKSKTEIHIYLVLQKKNFRQFLDFIKFGDSIGVDSVSGCFIKYEGWNKNRDVSMEKLNKKELEKFAEDLKKLSKETKAHVEIDDIMESINSTGKKGKRDWAKEPCYKPWYSPFITWDGIVSPCCSGGMDKTITFGDATKENFNDIWNSKRVQAFRKMVMVKRVGVCAECDCGEAYLKEQFEKIPFL